MPVEINREKLINALVDGITIVRNASNNRMTVPISITRYKVVSVPQNSTSIAITDPDTDSNYMILSEVNWNTTVYVTDKTQSGFVIRFGTPAPSNATLTLIKIRVMV